MSSDQEFAAWLRSQLRQLSEAEVEEIERKKDAEAGEYVPHHHHVYFGEARH